MIKERRANASFYIIKTAPNSLREVAFKYIIYI